MKRAQHQGMTSPSCSRTNLVITGQMQRRSTVTKIAFLLRAIIRTAWLLGDKCMDEDMREKMEWLLVKKLRLAEKMRSHIDE